MIAATVTGNVGKDAMTREHDGAPRGGGERRGRCPTSSGVYRCDRTVDASGSHPGECITRAPAVRWCGPAPLPRIGARSHALARPSDAPTLPQDASAPPAPAADPSTNESGS
jgi:hypothetical protein